MANRISRDNLNEILKDLGKTYRKMGGKAYPAEITLVGGAAVMAMYDFRESSMDIDAIIRAGGALNDAARIVGDKYGLDFEWLNSDFENTGSFSTGIRQHSCHYRTFANVLDVRIVEPEYLLAMKVRSGREYKTDLSDIVGIVMEERKRGNYITYETAEEVYRSMYPGETVPNNSGAVLREACNTKTVEEMELLYKRIFLREKETKRAMEAFNRAHPGVMRQNNVADIIAYIRKAENDGKDTSELRINDIQKKLDSFGEKVESNKQTKNRSEERKQKGDDGSR